MVSFAYDIPEYQIQGGEPWLTRDRWNVQASTGSLEATRPQALPNEQALLADASACASIAVAGDARLRQ